MIMEQVENENLSVSCVSLKAHNRSVYSSGAGATTILTSNSTQTASSTVQCLPFTTTIAKSNNDNKVDGHSMIVKLDESQHSQCSIAPLSPPRADSLQDLLSKASMQQSGLPSHSEAMDRSHRASSVEAVQPSASRSQSSQTEMSDAYRNTSRTLSHRPPVYNLSLSSSLSGLSPPSSSCSSNTSITSVAAVRCPSSAVSPVVPIESAPSVVKSVTSKTLSSPVHPSPSSSPALPVNGNVTTKLSAAASHLAANSTTSMIAPPTTVTPTSSTQIVSYHSARSSLLTSKHPIQTLPPSQDASLAAFVLQSARGPSTVSSSVPVISQSAAESHIVSSPFSCDTGRCSPSKSISSTSLLNSSYSPAVPATTVGTPVNTTPSFNPSSSTLYNTTVATGTIEKGVFSLGNNIVKQSNSTPTCHGDAGSGVDHSLNGSDAPGSMSNGALGSAEAKRERYPPPPLGIIDDPLIYGINLGITGELVSSHDVETWEFPDMVKLKSLRDRLILFMEENRLKQADICRFTGLGAPYLSFMVKDPTISNFSSRRRVEVYSVLQTFFNKIDRKEVTLDDIARLVLLSKATARAANSKRRGAHAKLGATGIRPQGEGDTSKPVIRRRRRGRPKMLERSREDEFLNSGIKEDSTAEFNFADFIAASRGSGDYLSHGLADEGAATFTALTDSMGWDPGATRKPMTGGSQRRQSLQRHRNALANRWTEEDSHGGRLLSSNLEEWRLRAPALFSRDGGLDLTGSGASSGIQTPVGFRKIDRERAGKDSSQVDAQTFYNVGEILHRSQDLFEPQNQHSIIQSLVNAVIVNRKETSMASLEDDDSVDHAHQSLFPCKRQRQQMSNKDETVEEMVMKIENDRDDSPPPPETQTEILNALIHNLIHQENLGLSSSPKVKEQSSQSTTMPHSKNSPLLGRQYHQKPNPPPTFSLLGQDNIEKSASMTHDAPSAKQKQSPSQLASLLHAIVTHHKGDLEAATSAALSTDPSSHVQVRDSNKTLAGAIGRSEANQPLQTSITLNDNLKICFGRGWVREVDIGLLNGDPYADISSNRSFDDDSESSFVLPRSGRVCVVRLQWNWDGGSFDEDILWDMTENGSSVHAFVESYIREMGLPRHPIGTQLLMSFKKQVESAQSFESIFELVCQHLLINLGHSNIRHLPGITRKLIIDCFHEGLRVIDAVTWNLSNSVSDARMFLRSLIRDLNLPTSFMSVLFAAFIRALAKERLKFIQECNDVLLSNVRTEISRHNATEFKGSRKRGYTTPQDHGRKGSFFPLEDAERRLVKRLRRVEPVAREENNSSKEDEERNEELATHSRELLVKETHQSSESEDRHENHSIPVKSNYGTILTPVARDGRSESSQEEREVSGSPTTNRDSSHTALSLVANDEEEEEEEERSGTTGMAADLDEICSSELSSSSSSDHDGQQEESDELNDRQSQLSSSDSPQPYLDAVMYSSTMAGTPTHYSRSTMIINNPVETVTSSQSPSQAPVTTYGSLPHVSHLANNSSAHTTGSTVAGSATPGVPMMMGSKGGSVHQMNDAVSGRPIFPLALKPTAMVYHSAEAGSSLPSSGPFSTPVVAHPTRVVTVPSSSPFYNSPSNTTSKEDFQRSPSNSLTTGPWADNKTAASAALDQTSPSGQEFYQQSSTKKRSTGNLRDTLSSTGPLVLRSTHSILSKSTFDEAVSDPSGLIHNETKDEDIHHHRHHHHHHHHHHQDHHRHDHHQRSRHDQIQKQQSIDIMEGAGRRSTRRSELGRSIV